MKTVTTSMTPASAALGQWAIAILGGKGEKAEALAIAEREGFSPRVKAAIAPISTPDGDMAAFANSRSILITFVPLLRNSSAFFRLLDGGMLRVPLKTRITFLTGAVSANEVGEGQVTPVRRFAGDSVTAEPKKVAAIVAFSEEWLKFLSENSESFLSAELRRAISAAVDAALFATLGAAGMPTLASTGSNAIAAAVDLRYLFTAVALTAESRPLLVAAPDVAIKAATLIDANMNFLFPGMSPSGGEMCGVPVIVSDALAAGTLGLIDGAAIAGDVQGIELRSARHATIQLDDNPDSPPTASTTPINLWQRNLVGVKLTVFFAAVRLRATAMSTVTGIAWGSTDSPA